MGDNFESRVYEKDTTDWKETVKMIEDQKSSSDKPGETWEKFVNKISKKYIY